MKGLVEHLHRIKNASPNKTAGSFLELAWDGEENLTRRKYPKNTALNTSRFTSDSAKWVFLVRIWSQSPARAAKSPYWSGMARNT